MKSYHTIAGFLREEEPDDLEPTVSYHATLRVYSETGLDFDAIEATLGVKPTQTLRRGDTFGPRSPTSKGDLWLYRAPVEERKDLAEHLNALRAVLVPHVEFISQLKQDATLSVSLGYASNVDHGGVSIPWGALDLFIMLKLDIMMYITVVTGDD